MGYLLPDGDEIQNLDVAYKHAYTKKVS